MKIRENYEMTNVKDDENDRKLRIRTRLLDQMDGWKNERRYQSYEGFVINWDWCMNIPKKYDRCKITWGIFLKG